jgi:hypothetical protein
VASNIIAFSVNGLLKSPHPFVKETDECGMIKTFQNLMSFPKGMIEIIQAAFTELALQVGQ